MTGLFDGALKRSKRQVIRDNAAQGKYGERLVKENLELGGHKVTRTGHGHDFKATRKNWLTGKRETKYVEVKTGNATLTPLQKKKKRSLGEKFVVVRPHTPTSPTPLFDSTPSSGRKSKRKAPKKPKGGLLGVGGTVSIWGTPAEAKRKAPKKPKGGLLGVGGTKKGRKKSAPKWSF